MNESYQRCIRCDKELIPMADLTPLQQWLWNWARSKPGYCGLICDPDSASNRLERQKIRSKRLQEQQKERDERKQEREKFYYSSAWREVRIKVLAKYGHTCSACGEACGKMHVDHIKPRSKYPELELDMENLQILCEACNL